MSCRLDCILGKEKAMEQYSESDVTAAYNELCADLATEGQIAATDWDGLARVAADAEGMIANELARQGMNLTDAVNAVQESSTKTARATDISRRLVEASKNNRFQPIQASNDQGDNSGDSAENAEVSEAPDDGNASDEKSEKEQAPAPDKRAPASVSAIVPQPVAMVSASVERAQRLRNKIDYKVEMKKVSEIFRAIDAKNPLFDFEVPYIAWDKPHPGVPAVDKAYNMEEDSLATVLYAIAKKKSTAIVGPHGAGKTKLVEQVGARLNIPVTIIPVDGQITRSELFGQEKIRSTASGPESYFQYGILPMALEEPGFILFDEIDRADPAIQYACHSVYEQTHLLLMEHDGRRIPLHQFNRVFATANTKGRGSDDGMYGGDNEMSEATRDRFSLWIEIDYQDVEDDIMVLKAKITGLDDKCAKVIAKFAQMIRNGFKDASLSQTCSMRQQLEAAEMAVHFIATMKAKTKEEKMACLRRAIDRVIIGRANEQDKNSMQEFLTSIEPSLTTV